MKSTAQQIIKKDLSQNDIILIDKYKYIVYEMKKDAIVLLPIDDMLNDVDYRPTLIPKIEVTYLTLKDYKKVNNSEIFCLLNQSNFLIQKLLKIAFGE